SEPTSDTILDSSSSTPAETQANGGQHLYQFVFTARGVVTGLLLAVGVLIAYSPQLAPTLWGRVQSPADTLTYIADLDYWQRTNREIQVVANARFDLDTQLTNVPLTLGD